MNLTTTPILRRLAPLLRTSTGGLLLAVCGWSQELPVRDYEALPPPPPVAPSAPEFDVQALCAAPFAEVLFDEPGDGALWARGASYKARFDGHGATVVPFFGSDAPQNYPLGFEVQAALGGAPLAAVQATGAQRAGNVVRIDRGAFVEEYELAPDSLEQRFVFAALPAGGELAVRIGVETELAGQDLGASLRFGNALGHVDYSQAFALDAAGRKLALDSALVDGAIELRVPAGFVAAAAFPLVIDPFVTFFTVAGTGHHEFLPDVAYDADTDRWGVAYVDVWSATDYDVFVRLATGAGTLLATLTIDFSTTSWTLPAIADNNGHDVFLVCARATGAAGTMDIRGRIASPATLVVGPVLQISPQGGYRGWPDVGGDSWPGDPSFFCVVWQSEVSAFQSDIEYQLLFPTGAPSGPLKVMQSGPEWHERPAISNSSGFDTGDETAGWTIAWQRRFSAFDHDLYGAQLKWNGAILTPKFTIDASGTDLTLPVVSTMLDQTSPGSPRPYMVVYERDFGDHDIYGLILQGSTTLATVNLVGAFDPQFWYRDQRTPSVDSDGEQFVVGFDERDVPGGPNPDVYVCSYSWNGATLIPCEVHAVFAGSTQVEGEVVVHSMGSTGGLKRHFFGTWVFESLSNGYDVQGGLWDACTSAPGVAVCPGDGSGAACPCNNPGSPGHGCANGWFPSGAVLTAQGAASVSADTLVLECTGARPSQPGLFFQGDVAINGGQGAVFGDGLRCAGNNVVRLQTLTADGGGAATSTVSIAATAGLTPGLSRTYQFWYRDPALSPCGSGFNLSNGYQVVWQP